MEEEKIRMILDKILDRLQILDIENPKDWNTIKRCHRRFKSLSSELHDAEN